MKNKTAKQILAMLLVLILLVSNQTLTIATQAQENNIDEEQTIGQFTPEEQEYINNHKEIYVAGNNNLEPIESYNKKEEKYVGIIPELFQKITQISGIKFKYINKNDNWKSYAKENQVEIISGLINGKGNLEQTYFKSSIEFVKVPIEENDEIVSIAFTQIADEALINIVSKSLKQIDELEKEKIIVRKLIEYSNNNSIDYILVSVGAILAIIIITLFILYKKYKKEAKQAKYIDNITKRGNYQNMELDFNKMITDENRVSYCVVDIGLDIEHIEEIYGYTELEEILKNTADILDKYVNDNEGFARIYKDSFVIIANFISDKIITERVKLIIEKIKELGKDKTYGLEAYAGIYFLKRNDRNLTQAVYNAMQARNEAEQQKISVKKCTEALAMKTRKEKKLEREVLTAFENNEFTTHLQPLINLKNNSVAALEVLARWENPQVGLVKPGIFIHILKDNHMIDKLDILMYEKACKTLVQRRQENKRIFTIFCNFARETIEKNGFLEQIKQIAEKYDIPKEYIGIIISEGTLYQSTANLRIMIEKLREEGFSVLLDNFGATLYSFKDIQQFQIDYLKISPKLTEDLSDERTISITKGIIDMAHSLNIKVICEDFDTREKEQILREIGCDIVQGNAYYQPIPAEEYIMLA